MTEHETSAECRSMKAVHVRSACSVLTQTLLLQTLLNTSFAVWRCNVVISVQRCSGLVARQRLQKRT